MNFLAYLLWKAHAHPVDPNQGGLFNRPKAQLHPEIKTVHEKTGRTHQQRYYVKPDVPITPKPTGEELTLMSVLRRFPNADAARTYFENIRWPNGPVCPHCGHPKAYALKAKNGIRPGVYECGDCRKTFTVTVGTVMEATHFPLHKWLIAFYMMAASKTQVSALQLQRQLEIGSYATALFVCHRIRFALSDLFPADKLKGTVEMDETYIGGKTRGTGSGYKGNKTPVVSMVERDGRIRSRVVDKVTGKLIAALLDEHVDKTAHLNTDEATVYTKPGREYASHDTVVHKDKEYGRYDAKTGRHITTNTVEGYFGNTKNSIRGTHHAISPQHTELYMSELDQKYNTRDVTDGERAVAGIEKIEGKRLTRKQMYNRRNILPKPMNKAVVSVSNDELTMPEDEFDAIMRQALQKPAPDDDEREPAVRGMPFNIFSNLRKVVRK